MLRVLEFARRVAVGAAILAALGLAGAAAQTAAQPVEVDLELVLAIDISGSIDPEEALLQRQGYVAAFRDAAIKRAILSGYHGRIAVVFYEWSDAWRQQTLIGWTLLDSEVAIMDFARMLEDKPITVWTRTSITGAIRYAIKTFDQSPFKAERRVLDISGDGANNDGGLVTEARELALSQGIAINGLPIINERPNPWGFPNQEDLDQYYEGCVIGGPRAFTVVARSFEDFGEAVRKKLLQEIVDAVPDFVPIDIAQYGGRPRLEMTEGRPDFRAYIRPPYPYGCDIGERLSREFWQRRFGNPN
jgi:hypothetical protein